MPKTKSISQMHILKFDWFSFANFSFSFVLSLQYGSDEFPHDSPVGSTRYASPKAGGAVYQPEPYYDSTSGTWYSSPSSAYAPQSSASTYHHISPHLGPPHGHDHYSLSPGVTHDGHIQVMIAFCQGSSSMFDCLFVFSHSNNFAADITTDEYVSWYGCFGPGGRTTLTCNVQSTIRGTSSTFTT